MQSELLSLSKIFSEAIFRIPNYQRGYAWQEKQIIKDFWSDIEQLADGKNHYTGVLPLEPVSEEYFSRWDDDLWIIKAKIKPLGSAGAFFLSRKKSNMERFMERVPYPVGMKVRSAGR